MSLYFSTEMKFTIFILIRLEHCERATKMFFHVFSTEIMQRVVIVKIETLVQRKLHVTTLGINLLSVN